jgi:gluconate kinase
MWVRVWRDRSTCDLRSFLYIKTSLYILMNEDTRNLCVFLKKSWLKQQLSTLENNAGRGARFVVPTLLAP